MLKGLKNRMNRSEDCISKMEGVRNLPKEIERKGLEILKVETGDQQVISTRTAEMRVTR